METSSKQKYFELYRSPEPEVQEWRQQIALEFGERSVAAEAQDSNNNDRDRTAQRLVETDPFALWVLAESGILSVALRHVRQRAIELGAHWDESSEPLTAGVHWSNEHGFSETYEGNCPPEDISVPTPDIILWCGPVRMVFDGRTAAKTLDAAQLDAAIALADSENVSILA